MALQGLPPPHPVLWQPTPGINPCMKRKIWPAQPKHNLEGQTNPRAPGGSAKVAFGLQCSLSFPSPRPCFLLLLTFTHVETRACLHNHLAGCVSEFPSQKPNLQHHLLRGEKNVTCLYMLCQEENRKLLCDTKGLPGQSSNDLLCQGLAFTKLSPLESTHNKETAMHCDTKVELLLWPQDTSYYSLSHLAIKRMGQVRATGSIPIANVRHACSPTF